MYCLDASVLTNSEIESERFHEFGTKLISLDKQQTERAAECIEVATPEEELKNL